MDMDDAMRCNVKSGVAVAVAHGVAVAVALGVGVYASVIAVGCL